jgi:methyl-accepting chemotaxis protein
MLVNVRIGPKLIGGFVSVALLCVLVGAAGILSMSRMNEKADMVTSVTVPQLDKLGDYQVALATIRRFEFGMVVARETRDDALFRKYAQDYKTALVEKVEKGAAVFDAIPRSEEAEKIWQDVQRKAAAYLSAAAVTHEALEGGRLQEGTKNTLNESRSSYEAASEALTALNQRATATSIARAEELNSIASTGRLTIIISSAIALLLAVGLGLLLTRSLTGPLTDVAARAEQLQAVCITQLEAGLQALGRGDVTVAVVPQTKPLQFARKDELGDVANTVDSMIVKAQASIASYSRVREVVAQLVAETTTLAAAGRDGHLSTRGNAEAFHGSYRDLVQGFNDTLDAVIDPVNEATAVLEKVAARDLTVRVEGQYKGDHARIKEALNKAVADLAEALAEVSTASEQVASASSQISNGAQGLAQGASEQASTIEEVSSSLHEMTSMAQQSAQNAREARTMAEDTKSSTLRGVDSMKSLSGAVERINSSAERTAKIVKTIDEIAFQTNLLALNAAVEAARAGDAGKGFAVVAEEVRALAMRAAEASRQTAELIEESGQHAIAGVTYTSEVVKSLDEIAVKAQKVSEVMSEISAASEQQQTGVTQVNAAIEQMNLVTQQVAANSEESASAAEELSSQAMHMQSMLGQFRISHGGGMHSARPAANRPAAVAARKSPGNGNGGHGNGHGAKPAKLAAKPSTGGRNGHATAAKPNRVATLLEEIIPFEDHDDDDTLSNF